MSSSQLLTRSTTNIHSPSNKKKHNRIKHNSRNKIRSHSHSLSTSNAIYNHNNMFSSLYSMNTTISSNNNIISLDSLPTEILINIIFFVNQKQSDILNLLLLSKIFYYSTLPILYYNPKFISTYRLSQFINTINNNINLSKLVHILNLSSLCNNSHNTNSIPIATWRDWKYRYENISTDLLYRKSISSNSSNSSSSSIFYENNTYNIKTSSHPLCNKSLLKFSDQIDIPTDYIIIILKNCINLNKINLSNLILCHDNTLNELNIFDNLLNLNNLIKLKLDAITWCNFKLIKNLILSQLKKKSSTIISHLSFRKSGLNKHSIWSTRGSFNDFLIIICLNEIDSMDSIQLENIFNIKKKFNYYSDSDYYNKNLYNNIRSIDIIENSNYFPITFNTDSTILFKLTILDKKNHRTDSIIDFIENNSKIHITINLSNRIRRDYDIKSHKKIDRCTRRILSKIKELLSDDLRRNLGCNNY